MARFASPQAPAARVGRTDLGFELLGEDYPGLFHSWLFDGGVEADVHQRLGVEINEFGLIDDEQLAIEFCRAHRTRRLDPHWFVAPMATCVLLASLSDRHTQHKGSPVHNCFALQRVQLGQNRATHVGQHGIMCPCKRVSGATAMGRFSGTRRPSRRRSSGRSWRLGSTRHHDLRVVFPVLERLPRGVSEFVRCGSGRERRRVRPHVVLRPAGPCHVGEMGPAGVDRHGDDRTIADGRPVRLVPVGFQIAAVRGVGKGWPRRTVAIDAPNPRRGRSDFARQGGERNCGSARDRAPAEAGPRMCAGPGNMYGLPSRSM